MRIRDATPDDLPGELHQPRQAAIEASALGLEQRTVWAERLTEEGLGRLLELAGLRVADDGGPLGFAGRIADHVEMLYVDPRAQGKGVGKALLRDLERSAHAGGIHTLRLVTADNAVGFYEARGWRVERAADEDIDGVTFRRTYMVKA